MTKRSSRGGVNRAGVAIPPKYETVFFHLLHRKRLSFLRLELVLLTFWSPFGPLSAAFGGPVRSAAAVATASGKTTSDCCTPGWCTRTFGRRTPPESVLPHQQTTTGRAIRRRSVIYEVYPSVGDDPFGRVRRRRSHGLREEVYGRGRLRLVPEYQHARRDQCVGEQCAFGGHTKTIQTEVYSTE